MAATEPQHRPEPVTSTPPVVQEAVIVPVPPLVSASKLTTASPVPPDVTSVAGVTLLRLSSLRLKVTVSPSGAGAPAAFFKRAVTFDTLSPVPKIELGTMVTVTLPGV